MKGSVQITEGVAAVASTQPADTAAIPHSSQLQDQVADHEVNYVGVAGRVGGAKKLKKGKRIVKG